MEPKTKPFLLLEPGSIEPDPFLATSDLISKHGLSKISNVVLSGNNKVDNYLQTDKFKPFRKGEGMDLAPLADAFPSTNPPEFAPLTVTQLQEAFTFEAGPAVLPGQHQGLPVDTNPLLGGPRSTAGKAPAAAPSAGGAAKPTFKFKVKLGDGGTTKKK